MGRWVRSGIWLVSPHDLFFTSPLIRALSPKHNSTPQPLFNGITARWHSEKTAVAAIICPRHACVDPVSMRGYAVTLLQ